MSAEHSSEESTIRFSAEDIESIQLLETVPRSRRLRLEVFLLRPELNMAQKRVLAADAADMKRDFSTTLETARTWRTAAIERARQSRQEAAAELGNAALREDTSLNQASQDAVEVSELMQQLASERQAGEEAQPGPASEIGNIKPSPSEAEASSSVVEAKISTMPPQFAEFKQVLSTETARHRQHSQQAGKPMAFLKATSNPGSFQEGEPLEYIFKAMLGPKANSPYLKEQAISASVAGGVLRALRGTERGRSINYPRDFQPAQLERQLHERTFERPRPLNLAHMKRFSTNQLQVPIGLISSVRLAHRIEGKIVELSDEEQPRNPQELFERVFQAKLPEAVFEALAHSGRFQQSQGVRVAAESMVVGPLQGGGLGIELKIVLPGNGGNFDEFARLGAGLLSNSKLMVVKSLVTIVY